MDIEGSRLPRRPRRHNNFSRRDSQLFGKLKKRGVAALFLILEAVSVVLDVFGKSKSASLAAFLLSGFGFAINMYISFIERTATVIKPQAERQLGIVEIVFSVLQLIATSIHFILLVSDVKYNYSASVLFPLAFAIIAIVFVFREEGNFTDSSVEGFSSTNLSLANDSLPSTSIELDRSGTTVNDVKSANNLHMRSRKVQEDPGIRNFQIVGEPEPGRTLVGCGYGINGTTVCMFQWVRLLQDGSKEYIEGATYPEYVVTADDVDNKLIGLECIPMDDQGREGKLLGLFANEHSKIKCDPEMQREIDMHMSKGEATFSVLFLIDSFDNLEPATLILRQSSYKVKTNSTEAVIVEENFSDGLSIKISSGNSQFILKCSDGASLHFSTHNVRMRDTLVLTMRMFQSKALDAETEGSAVVENQHEQ